MRAVALVVLFLSFGSITAAHARGVRGLALPTRDRPEQLRDLARDVAAALSERLDAHVVPHQPEPALARELSSARQLAAVGELERAKGSLEHALERALDRLHRLPPELDVLPALVEHAAIQVAAGETERAGKTFDTILALDPGFELTPEERSPRMASAIDSARRRVASDALSAASLGEACRDGADVLIATRRTRSGAIEIFRYDDCRFMGSVTTRGDSGAGDLASALDPKVGGDDEPFYKSGWFWAGTGAVVVAGSVAAYFLLQPEPRTEVRPIF